MDWLNWSNVTFQQRQYLPSCSGIYIVADSDKNIWYVGQAINIKSRWAGKSHHRYPQLIRSNKKRQFKIYWKQVPPSLLTQTERQYIQELQPELNHTKVKKYLPQKPQVEREIKRLLKILNKPTYMFPLTRSVVAGTYQDNGEIQSIIVIINHYDIDLLYESMRKKRSPKIRNAWGWYRSYCSKNGQYYQSISIPCYSFFNYRFEFLQLPESLIYLETYLDTYENYIGVTKLFDVEVRTLKYKNVISQLPSNQYVYTNSNGKKRLQNLDYLKYRYRSLRCFY